ncbi:MAG: methyltransferase domain-containing protein, partial [Melioribacteraceae bacterium]
MNDRIYNSGIGKLRSPERIERLEVERVVDICLANENVASVLDVGTGSGLFAEAFHKRGIRVAGADINCDMIDAAKKNLPDSEFKISSAEELPFDDK